MSGADSSMPLPRPEPPAFPLRVRSYTLWVAVGPFGLLYQSFSNPDIAKGAVSTLVKQLHSLQEADEVEALLDLGKEYCSHFKDFEGLSERWQAAEIFFPANEPEFVGEVFFTALDKTTLLPLSTGVSSAAELVLAVDAEELRIQSSTRNSVDVRGIR